VEIDENIDLYEWLCPLKEMKTPDLYIVCLQEIVSLNAKNIILSSNSNKVDQWRNIFLKNMSKIDK